ncbi:MAG: S1C family serine protease [Patescibacteria group bacterium]|jgi:S1-C subfamily serine protease|nr:S1C family serine protease [bacterium]
MSAQKNRLLPMIIVAFVCGFIAGVAGEIITRVYILNDYSIPYFYNEVNLDDLNYNRPGLIIRDAKKVVVNHDVKVAETINSIRPSLVGIYKNLGVNGTSATSSPATPATTTALVNLEYYKLDEPIFIGLIVTSDGWVAASLPEALEKTFNIKDYVAITADKKIYQLEQISTLKDLPGDLFFFRLAAVNNLTVRKITDQSEISLGQSVLAINDFNNAFLTSISSFRKSTALLSSDSLNARFSLANDLGDEFKNSFVFDIAGNLVAVISANKEIVPAFSYTRYWQSLLQNGTVTQPFLGVHYLDLSTLKVLGLNMEKGAWLKSGENLPAIIKNSPAELAGLKEGDIISWINNQEINAYNDLANIISGFNPGDTINITYLRNGEEKIINVKLGEKK